jgi:hypothetical protein
MCNDRGEGLTAIAPGGTVARMRLTSRLALFALVVSPRLVLGQSSYLFVWAGGRAGNEMMATIDATPGSATYGRVVASASTGTTGMPHHTEPEFPASGHLLANDFHAGRTWLFDLRDALHPRILTSFGDVAGYSHPHTFVRLAGGRVLSTFQYRAAAKGSADSGDMRDGMSGMEEHVTGGLVEMDEFGRPSLSGSAADTTIQDRMLYPYSVLPIPSMDRAVSTTTDMDHADTIATSQWVQIWRLSDLKLLTTFALPPGPRGDENKYTGESRLLAGGRSVYIHTFNCGLYLLRNIESGRPTAKFVKGFEGTDCGVPILTGHYWLQTVPDAHSLVALDISDPEHPREVSRVNVGADEYPHWIAIDARKRRIVLNSAGRGSRLFIIDFDPATGALTLDTRFRDAGSDRPGISLTGSNWPGFTGMVVPHGAVFSR